jgi:hypothetical protein
VRPSPSLVPRAAARLLCAVPQPHRRTWAPAAATAYCRSPPPPSSASLESGPRSVLPPFTVAGPELRCRPRRSHSRVEPPPSAPCQSREPYPPPVCRAEAPTSPSTLPATPPATTVRVAQRSRRCSHELPATASVSPPVRTSHLLSLPGCFPAERPTAAAARHSFQPARGIAMAWSRPSEDE